MQRERFGRPSVAHAIGFGAIAALGSVLAQYALRVLGGLLIHESVTADDLWWIACCVGPATAVGYGAGWLHRRTADRTTRSRRLLLLGAAAIAAGALLHGLADGADARAEAAGLVVLGAALLVASQLVRSRSAGTTATIAALLAFADLLSCIPPPLFPSPGVKDYQKLAFERVRDGRVNRAGLNLLVEGPELSIDTRLMQDFRVGVVFNSATETWQWSFDQSLVGGVFRDATGAEYTNLSPGPIRGSAYVYVNATTIDTRGRLRHEFDASGLLGSIHWAHARYPSIEFRRSAGRVASIDQCTRATTCSRLFTVAYSGSQVTSVVDFTGRRLETTWNGDGTLALARSPFEVQKSRIGRRFAYPSRWAFNGRIATMTIRSSEDEEWRYDFDGAGRLTSAQAIGGPSPRWTYRMETAPQRAVVTDPDGVVWTYRFSPAGELTERILPTDTVESWGYADLRPIWHTDEAGVTERQTWGANDELATQTSPSGAAKSYEWTTPLVNFEHPFEAIPTRIARTAPGTPYAIFTATADAFGRPIATTNGAGEVTRTTYGELETIASIERPDGVVTAFLDYGAHGHARKLRTYSASDPDVFYEETRRFDDVGNMLVGTDPGSRTGTQWPGFPERVFNHARKTDVIYVACCTGPNADQDQDLVFSYRSDLRLEAVHRPSGSEATFAFDAIGREIERSERVNGAWETTRFEWTPRGELLRITRANGMRREFAYDAAGHVVRQANSTGGVLESQVDTTWEDGRMTQKRDSTEPAATRYTYDDVGRLATIRWPDRERTLFAYDGWDRLATQTLRDEQDALVGRLSWSHDGADRLLENRFHTDVTNELLFAWTWSNGRNTRIVQGNGLRRDRSFDPMGRVAGVATVDSRTDTVVEHETIVREAAAFLGSYAAGNPKVTVDYAATTAFGPRSTHEQVTGFAYPYGGRWSPPYFPDTGTNGWIGGDGEQRWYRQTEHQNIRDVASTAGHDQVFDYNAEGNRLLRIRTVDASGESVDHRYAYDASGFCIARDDAAIGWDATGHMTSWSEPGLALTMRYDAEGALRRMTFLGESTRLRFGGLVEADDSGSPRALELGGVRLDLRSTRRLYRHTDYRGNVKSTSNELGEIRSVNVYSPFRLERTEGDQGDTRGFATGTAFGDLVLLGDRIYDQAALRFLGPDPTWHTMNQFFYANNDPTYFWDPDGRRTAANQTAGYTVAGDVGGALGAAMGTTFAFGLGIGALAVSGPGGAFSAALATGTIVGVTAYVAKEGFQQAYTVAYDQTHGAQFGSIGRGPGGSADPAGQPDGGDGGDGGDGDGDGGGGDGGGDRKGDARGSGGSFYTPWGGPPGSSRTGGPFGGGSSMGGCGLTGIEPFLLLPFLVRGKRMRRRERIDLRSRTRRDAGRLADNIRAA